MEAHLLYSLINHQSIILRNELSASQRLFWKMLHDCEEQCQNKVPLYLQK